MQGGECKGASALPDCLNANLVLSFVGLLRQLQPMLWPPALKAYCSSECDRARRDALACYRARVPQKWVVRVQGCLCAESQVP